jgi:hypothetical protein
MSPNICSLCLRSVQPLAGERAGPIAQQWEGEVVVVSGRALPDGLTFVASYVTADLGRCFQRWIADWQEVAEFEVVPVVEGKVTREALEPLL